MKHSKKLLSAVLKTTQMGQAGVRSVLDIQMRPDLRGVLEAQLREYDAIENETHAIASERGLDLQELDPAVRFFYDRMTRIKVTCGNCDSKIADTMIQGNTRGMIRCLKSLHQFPEQDGQIRTVSQKLLDCQTANIRQMQSYL